MPDVTLPGTGTKIETIAGVGGAERQVIHVANLPASQPVTVESLPLPPGASTEATAAALLVAANAIKAAAETLAGRTINTSAVAGTVALDAGTLAALESISADISGTVDISNFPAATALTDTELRAAPVPITSASAYAEDSPHVSGAIGNLMLAIRSDNDLPTANDGDYTILKMDEEGRLKVASKPASYPDITGNITAIQATIGTPVAGGTVSGDVSRASNVMAFCTGVFAGANVTFEGSLETTGDTNWFGLQAVRTNANTIESATGALSAQPAYGWELSVNGLKRVRVRCTALTSGTQSWRLVQGTYATEPIPAAQVSATQPVSGTVTATVTGGTVLPVTPTTTFTNSLATTNALLIKNTAGTLWSIVVSNTNAAARFLKLFNLTAAPTVGTSVPVFTVPIPPGGTVLVNGGSNGIRFGTGISLAITGAAGDLDTTAIGAGDVKVATTFT